MPDRPHVEDACAEGEHVIGWSHEQGARVCAECGLSTQTLSNWLGHDLG